MDIKLNISALMYTTLLFMFRIAVKSKKGLLKIADFPEEDLKMEDTIPSILEEVHRTMPFKRHILPSGAMNLVSSVHWAMNMPDIKAKFFAGDGTTQEDRATHVHTDLTNAANICQHVEDSPENLVEEKVKFLQQFFPKFDARKRKLLPSGMSSCQRTTMV